jgi:hypothetical protein
MRRLGLQEVRVEEEVEEEKEKASWWKWGKTVDTDDGSVRSARS